jgi:hypothetical protein
MNPGSAWLNQLGQVGFTCYISMSFKICFKEA